MHLSTDNYLSSERSTACAKETVSVYVRLCTLCNETTAYKLYRPKD